MLKTLQDLRVATAPLAGLVLSWAAATQLTGCIVAPPPRAYVAPPPPPAYVAPAAEVDLQANEAPPPLPEYAQPPCPVEGEAA